MTDETQAPAADDEATTEGETQMVDDGETETAETLSEPEE